MVLLSILEVEFISGWVEVWLKSLVRTALPFKSVVFTNAAKLEEEELLSEDAFAPMSVIIVLALVGEVFVALAGVLWLGGSGKVLVIVFDLFAVSTSFYEFEAAAVLFELLAVAFFGWSMPMIRFSKIGFGISTGTTSFLIDLIDTSDTPKLIYLFFPAYSNSRLKELSLWIFFGVSI